MKWKQIKKKVLCFWFGWMELVEWRQMELLLPPLNSKNSNYGIMGYKFSAQQLFNHSTTFHSTLISLFVHQLSLASWKTIGVCSSRSGVVWWIGQNWWNGKEKLSFLWNGIQLRQRAAPAAITHQQANPIKRRQQSTPTINCFRSLFGLFVFLALLAEIKNNKIIITVIRCWFILGW